MTTEDALDILHGAYDHEPFVVVTDHSPSTKATTGSNCAHLTVRVDPRTGWVVALAAIDNLVKGAAGQAVQCANLALALPETPDCRWPGSTREHHRPADSSPPESPPAIKASGALDLALLATEDGARCTHRRHVHRQPGRRGTGPGQP